MESAFEEEPLAGGNVADGVVRIGETVRKPATPSTAAVQALLRHLRDSGLDTVPEPHGLDEQGRQVLEYVPGRLAHDHPPLDLDGLRRVGRMIKDLHDAAESFEAPQDPAWDVVITPDREDLICHHDLAPWNLVQDGDRWVFIDWDGAGPGSRLWDLGYAAHGFVVIAAGNDPVVDGERLAALVDGYGLDTEARRRLPRAMIDHTRGMERLLIDGHRTGTQPWARLYAEGHADHWGPAADYLEENHDHWLSVLL